MTKKQEKKTPVAKATDYCCPCCDKPLYFSYGNQMYPGERDHGVMLFCIHGDPNARSHPQEVAGHAFFKRIDEDDSKALARAYGIIRAKFCGAKLENEGEPVEVVTD